MDEDNELLRRFAHEGAQDAFAELVRRRVDLVFAAAQRQTGGDAHLAQDVTQQVFLALACRASALTAHTVLTGWLFTTTRYLAIRAMRQQRRWQRREHEASAMHSSNPEPSPAWENLRPVIDEALYELEEKDRTALLLRFFDGRSLAEVGAGIGLNENSARMRVERALEKLRCRLAKRGVTSTVAALGVALASQPAMAAPAGLAAAATGSALAGAAAGASVALPLLHFMSMTKLTVGAIGVAAFVGTGAYFVGAGQGTARDADLAVLRAENQRLFADLQQQKEQAARTVSRPGSGAQPAGPRLVDQAAAVAQRRGEREAAAAQKSAVGRPLGNPAGAPSPASIESLRTLADLKNRNLANIDIAFVMPNGQLSPNFAGLFGLTNDERTTLQHSVDRARERMAAAEQANATVAREPGGDVVIKIGSFAQEGGAVYDDLMKSFADTLGPDRNAVFQVLGGARVESSLGFFGAAERTVSFSVEGSDAQKRYKVSIRRNRPGESGTSTSSFDSLQKASDWAGTVSRLIPADFGK